MVNKQVWIKQFPNGNKIKIEWGDKSEISIMHKTGSRISILDDGDIEIKSSKDIYLIGDDVLVKCNKFVLNSMGGGENFCHISGDLKLNVLGNTQVDIGGSNRINILGDYISMVRSKTEEVIMDFKLNSGIINFKTTNLEINTNSKKENISGESLFNLSNSNGNYTYRIPGNLNIVVDGDLNLKNNNLNIISTDSMNILNKNKTKITTIGQTFIKTKGRTVISSPDINFTPG